MANLFEYLDVIVIENDDSSISFVPKAEDNQDYKYILRETAAGTVATKYTIKETDKTKKVETEYKADKGKGK